MPTLARHLLLVLALVASARPARAADTIYWYTNLKDASEAALKANLPMMLDFWADWCGPCVVMDAEVYTDPQVISAFQRKIIGVRLHFDMQPQLARQFKVGALPYLVFTNSYGTPLVYHRGFLEAEALARVVEAMPPIAEINRLDRALQEDDHDFAALLAMARALRATAFFDSSNAYYARAAKHRTASADAVARESILYDMALNSLELRNGRQAAAVLEKYLKAFPAHARRPDALLALGRAYTLDGRTDKARKTLSALVGGYPESPAAAEARSLLQSR